MRKNHLPNLFARAQPLKWKYKVLDKYSYVRAIDYIARVQKGE